MGNKSSKKKTSAEKPSKAKPSKPKKSETKPKNSKSDSTDKKSAKTKTEAIKSSKSDPPKKTEKPKPNSSPTSEKKSEPKKTEKPKPKPSSSSSAEETSGDKDGTAADLLCEVVQGTAPKKVTKDDFEILKVIGRGSFGKVMQVRKKDTGQIYAMKVMRKENIIAKNQIVHTKDEKNVLQRIQHPFIVKLHNAFQTPEKLYMILDFVNGGEVFFHLKKCGKFSENRTRLYAAEIASALIHLHANGIVYRDLKPENLLLDAAGHIVITDFGLAKQIPNDGSTHTFCGTPEYLAPEVLTGEGHSFPVDWWSLGTLVYEMLTGLPPFYAEVTAEMYQKIVNGELIFPQEMSDDACDLLSALLERDPDDRMGADTIQSHPWFSSIDWDLLVEKKIKPEYIPPVKDSLCVQQIDEYFLQEAPEDSVVPKKKPLTNAANKEVDPLFENFTYAATTALNK